MWPWNKKKTKTKTEVQVLIEDPGTWPELPLQEDADEALARAVAAKDETVKLLRKSRPIVDSYAESIVYAIVDKVRAIEQ